MFKQETVLILGAGASYPYGFPLGGDLVERIIQLRDDQIFQSICGYAGIKHEVVKQFGDELEMAMPPSIDLFLDNRRTDFEQVGKLAIAMCLVGTEDEQNTRKPHPERWYHEFANQLGSYKKDIFENKLSIITFNYDRSLEFSLFRIFKTRFGLEEEEAVAMVKHFDIEHVYGKLGYLPSENTGGHFVRDYESELDPALIIECAKQLRLIYDLKHSETEERRKIQEKLKRAEFIFMMGCGFHDENMEILGLSGDGKSRNQNCHASCYNISEPEQARIQRRWPYFGRHHRTLAGMMRHCNEYFVVATA